MASKIESYVTPIEGRKSIATLSTCARILSMKFNIPFLYFQMQNSFNNNIQESYEKI